MTFWDLFYSREFLPDRQVDRVVGLQEDQGPGDHVLEVQGGEHLHQAGELRLAAPRLEAEGLAEPLPEELFAKGQRSQAVLLAQAPERPAQPDGVDLRAKG